jgi:hypothetical protein
MRRRGFITLVGGTTAAWAAALPAQERTWKLGWLSPSSAPPAGQAGADLETFKKALAESGYVEGRNYIVESRFANTDNSRLPSLAKIGRTQCRYHCHDRNTDRRRCEERHCHIPIVMAASADPVEHGLVASLQHPGGNVTGVTHSPGPEFAGKCLELLKEAAPAIARVGVLWDSSTLPLPNEMLRLWLGLKKVRDVSKEFVEPRKSPERDISSPQRAGALGSSRSFRSNPARRNSGSVVGRSVRIRGPTLRRSINYRRVLRSHYPYPAHQAVELVRAV